MINHGWEYKIIRVKAPVAESDGRALLNLDGKDGWEAFATAVLPYVDPTVLIFLKRRLP